MADEAKPSRRQALFGIILFSGAILCIAYITYQRILLSKNHKYTIGMTDGGRRTHKGRTIDYVYKINGIDYTGSKKPQQFSPKEKYGRYFVMYNPDNLSVSDILWDKPVPEWIKEAPADGWKEMP